MRRVVVLAVVVGFLFASLVVMAEDTVIGVVSVIDGDTIEIHGTRIRLHGIDAPESAQLCFDADDQPWRCGQKASLALADRIGRAHTTCRGMDVDRYGRVIAICVQAGEDLNSWMVAQGWAVAYRRYSNDYVGSEGAAEASGAGIWSSRFVMPWDWRRGQRAAVSPDIETPIPGCLIKGNISSGGDRIYHPPGGRWYEKTRIAESKGERWFCSESEAREAGWRRARQ